jgi:hypothetical protein
MKLRIAVLAIALSMGGCSHTGTYVIKHPGTVNQVDDQLYDSLLTARAAIESAKLQIATYPQLQAILNTKVIPPFNIVESAYLQYHAALVAGKAVDATPIQQQLLAVTAALADALKTAGVK